jgi:glycosyltransferase involved in cell wall biosynthesis
LDPRIPITIYLPSFAGGGAENALARLANFWVDEGRTVRFVVNAATGPVAARLRPEIEVVDLGIDNPARAFPGLLSWMARARPPLVATALMSANVTGALAARLRSPGTAMVALIRNHISAEILGKAPLKRMVGSAPLRWAYRQADAIGCVSSSVADDIVAYAGSDLLVLSSRYEGLPNVVLEALEAGVTVTATDAPGGSAELLENGRLGYLCAVGDVDGLARAMTDGLDRPIDPALLRAKAAEFEIGNVARRYEAAFAAAIDSHG